MRDGKTSKGYEPPFVKDHRRAAATLHGKLLKLAGAWSAAVSYKQYQIVPGLEDVDLESVDDYIAGMRDGVLIGLFSQFYATLTKKEQFLHEHIIIKLDTSKPMSVISYTMAAVQLYREFGYNFDTSGFPFVFDDGELRGSMGIWVEKDLCTVKDVEQGRVTCYLNIADDWPMFWPYMPRT